MTAPLLEMLPLNPLLSLPLYITPATVSSPLAVEATAGLPPIFAAVTPEPSPFVRMATAYAPALEMKLHALPAGRDEDEARIPSHPALTDRFFFGLGAGLLSSNTSAQLNSSVGVGTNVDFEDVLGLEGTSTVPEFLFRWRFTERWRLEFEYFQLNRSGKKTTQQDITWGDVTFPAGTAISTKFDVSVARVSCGYSFFKTTDKEVGVALGFHVTNFDASLEGTADKEGADVLAPLPVGSLYAQMALTDKWALAARLDAFRIDYGDYNGHVFAVGVDALWQPFRHWGFGVGWRSLEIEGGVDTGDWRGNISTTYQGPIAFISASF